MALSHLRHVDKEVVAVCLKASQHCRYSLFQVVKIFSAGKTPETSKNALFSYLEVSPLKTLVIVCSSILVSVMAIFHLIVIKEFPADWCGPEIHLRKPNVFRLWRKDLKKATGEWEGIYFMLGGVWRYEVFSYQLNTGTEKWFHCVTWMGETYKLVLQ